MTKPATPEQIRAALSAVVAQLDKAQHSAAFVRADLQAALKTATAVEALILLPLIEQAARLEAGIQNLRSARGSA